MTTYILVVVLVLALSLVVAGLAFGKLSPARAVILGILPILGMLVFFQCSNNMQLQECLARACVSQGLPPDCTVGEFGCGEGSGYVVALLMLTGLGQLIIYSLGVIVIWVVHSHKSATVDNARHPSGDQTIR